MIVDTSALVAIIVGEPGSERLIDAISRARALWSNRLPLSTRIWPVRRFLTTGRDAIRPA